MLAPNPKPSAGLALLLWPALAAAVLFANTLRNGFVYDDPLILEWLRTRRWDLEGFLTETRGMTYAVHAFDDWLWGTWAGGYHLTNILLHCAASSLCAYTAWSLTRSRAVGLATGLAFAVHPVHVEVVANIANRKDMLALIFSLLGFLAWRRIGRLDVRLATTALCYGLALYSKEVAAAGLVAMLFLADLWLPAPQRPALPSLRARAAHSLSQLSPLLAAGLIAAAVFSADLLSIFGAASIRKLSDGHYHTFQASLATSAGNLVEFFRLLLFPHRLQIDYPLHPLADLLNGRALLGLALSAAWLLLALALYKRSRVATFALVWVPVMLLPCSNLIPLHHIHIAERYLYVPSFGLCLALALGLRTLVKARPGARTAVVSAAGLVFIAAGARCIQRNADWRDVPALIAAADRDGVDTWRIHKTAASWAIRNDEDQTAARRYARAAELRPGDPDLQFWKAVSATRVGDLQSAVAAGRATVALRPDIAKAHYNLGLALVQTRDLEGAASQMRRTIQLEPDYVPAHYNLAVALTLIGNEVEAVGAFEECVRLDPNHAEAHFNLGTLQVQRGLADAALASLRKAAALEPKTLRFLEYLYAFSLKQGKPYSTIEAGEVLAKIQPGRTELLVEIGDLCMQVGEPARAIGHYRAAIDTDPDDTALLERLAEACERVGKPDWAERAYTRIFELAPGDENARSALRRLADPSGR